MHDESNDAPVAYLITFTAYGTWLHGDVRGSVDRNRNIYGTPRVLPDVRWKQREFALLKGAPVTLGVERRLSVRAAIAETCEIRGWELYASNVRTNHVHTVITALCRPERVVGALKANATRVLRERGLWSSDRSPWTRGGSTRYLWTQASLERAIWYVVDGQGASLDSE